MEVKELIKYIKYNEMLSSEELIKYIKYNEMLSSEMCEEIIQKLLEHDEMMKLANDAVDPLVELYNFLIGLKEDFQEGDIDYGGKK